MAEGEDKSQKTEEPTQKKLDDAREKGQVANSREINHLFMIFAGTLAMAIMIPSMATNLLAAFRPFLASSYRLDLNRTELVRVLAAVGGDTLMAMAPMFVILILGALGAGIIQNGVMFSTDKLKPKAENISLLKGVSRLFSAKSVAELIKGIFKLIIVGAVATLMIMPEMNRVALSVTMEPLQIVDLLWRLALRVLVGVSAIVALIAGVDFLYQRFEFRRSMKMSKQEIKDELKQSEGDPIVKSRLRQLRQDRARKRMMAAVPEADVVITNPTHFAIALVYDSSKMAAPRVIAKGVDTIARRIREIAEANDIAIVENPPLARALYDGVDIDREIPEAHYKAVAEVIGYVWRLKGKTRRRPAR